MTNILQSPVSGDTAMEVFTSSAHGTLRPLIGLAKLESPSVKEEQLGEEFSTQIVEPVYNGSPAL